MNARVRKYFASFILFACIGVAANASEVTVGQIKRIQNEAIADALTLVLEDAGEIPALSIVQMANKFRKGDYRDGISDFVSIATDEVWSRIPIMGPLKYAIGLETAVIKVGKSYLDNYMVDIAWRAMIVVSATDSDNSLEQRGVCLWL